MRTRCIAVAGAVLLAAACNTLPPWQGPTPPPRPIDDPCGSGRLTIAGATQLHRMPYVQQVRETGAVIAWAGMPEGQPRVVLADHEDPARHVIGAFLARHPGSPDAARERRDELYEELAEQKYEDDEDDDDDEDDEDDEALEPDDFYILAARVEGLEAGRRYCYRLENVTGSLTDWASLVAAPPPDVDRTLRFVVLGDTGSGSPAQLALARQIAGLRTDAILFAGDIAYPSGTHAQLQARFFDVYAEILQRVPAYAAIGNHDADTAGGRPFEEVFLLPRDRRWYSFDWGRVHFVVLDTTDITEAQAAWLDADLARRSRKLTVVLGHHPPYSSGWRASHPRWKELLLPVLVRHRVELVISGHDHHYERLEPIDGVTYVITGGGGGRLTSAMRRRDAVRLETVHHYLRVEVTGDELVVRAVGIEGKVIDEFRVRDRPDGNR